MNTITTIIKARSVLVEVEAAAASRSSHRYGTDAILDWLRAFVEALGRVRNEPLSFDDRGMFTLMSDIPS